MLASARTVVSVLAYVSGVVRIDPLRFLAGRMSYKATKPGLVSVLYLSMRYNYGIVVY